MQKAAVMVQIVKILVQRGISEQKAFEVRYSRAETPDGDYPYTKGGTVNDILQW